MQAWQEEAERARQGQRDAESKLSTLEAGFLYFASVIVIIILTCILIFFSIKRKAYPCCIAGYLVY